MYVTPLLLNVKASVSPHFVGDKVNDCDGDFFKAAGGDDMDRKKAFYLKIDRQGCSSRLILGCEN